MSKGNKVRGWKPVAENYIKLVGVELELWHLSLATVFGILKLIKDVEETNDAGLYLHEWVTAPCDEWPKAMALLSQLHEQRRGEVVFSPYRPDCLRKFSGMWQQGNPRYDTMLQSIRLESPRNWQKVNKMTDAAALQLNFSGDFEAFGDEGIWLMNFFNNIMPYLAASVHDITGLGKGHLALWDYEKAFAYPERFPNPNDWFENPADLKRYYENVPKLFLEVDGEYRLNINKEMQSISCPSDLGAMWKFFRLKMDSSNGYYMEFRGFPSMPLEQCNTYGQLVFDMVNALLYWYHNKNSAKPVTSIIDSYPAFEFMSDRFPTFCPGKPLTVQEWRNLIQY